MRRLLALALLLPLGPVAAPPGVTLPVPPPAPRVVASRATALPAYTRLLARHVREGTIDDKRLHVVDYAAIRRDADLGAALDELASARPEEMTRDEQLAFWINAYNLLAIRLVTDRYPIRRILDAGQGDREVWEIVAGTAGGRLVSLGEIEHVLIRERFREPRIHFALVAAAMSCPDLGSEPYDGARLDDQLEDAMDAFLADENRGVRLGRHGVEVSSLFPWFHEDFEPHGGIAAFIRAHAPAGVRVWLAGVDDHDLRHIEYDWNLNDSARSSVVRTGSYNPAPRNSV